MFIICNNKVLYYFDKSTLKFSVLDKNLSEYTQNHEPLSLINNEDYIWIGTYNGGLVRYHKKTSTYTIFKNDKSNSKSISNNVINSLYKDECNSIWIECYLGGINKFEKSQKFQTFLSGLIVACFYENLNGISWIGTQTNGLFKFDVKNQIWTNFLFDGNHKFSLSDNSVPSVYEDDENNIWVGTWQHGLNKAKVNIGTNELEFKHLLNNESVLFIKKAPKNILWLGTNNKLILKILTKIISQTEHITINYDQSMISFDFAALNYISSYKNKYMYMMQGFDNNWVNAENQRKATYTNLDPGDYTFLVKASNNDGVWNNNSTHIKISILPPWWAEWWFKFLVVF